MTIQLLNRAIKILLCIATMAVCGLVLTCCHWKTLDVGPAVGLISLCVAVCVGGLLAVKDQ